MKILDITFIPPEGEARPDPTRVILRATDYVRFEASTKKLVTGGLGYTDVMRLAFYGLLRLGLMPSGVTSFDEFVAKVDDIDPVADEEAEAADPLEASAGT